MNTNMNTTKLYENITFLASNDKHHDSTQYLPTWTANHKVELQDTDGQHSRFDIVQFHLEVQSVAGL